MKKSLSFLFVWLPFLLIAQTGDQPGVHFEDLPNWTSVKNKAKLENKYIFIDFFATWCSPCKKMDKEVYSVDSIGQFLDKNFVSVKIQTDSTSQDNQQTKAWYSDARYFQSLYKITSLPSFLFFSPDGKLVHEGIGFLDPGGFSTLAHNALNPEKQYYPLSAIFRQGKLAYSVMPYLANTARSLKDLQMADAVAKKYVESYLLKLPENELYTVRNLGFMASFTHGSQNKAFKIFYGHAKKVDTTMKLKNFAQNLIDVIIEREEINDLIYKDGKPFQLLAGDPDWDKVENRIKNKYNLDYAGRVVLWAKIKWLESKKNWPEYCKNVILKIEKYGPYQKYFPYASASFSHDFLLNASAWELFSYSTDSNDLAKALAWSDKAIKESPAPNAEYMDTYANLLYKIGRTEDAINLEEKAFALAPKADDIRDNLAKIKKGEPTWVTQ